jgi:hypothetical protein
MLDDYVRSVEPLIAIVLGSIPWKSRRPMAGDVRA